MNPDDVRKLTDTAALDQLDASLATVAGLLGSFYQHLVKSGLPGELAEDMVRDYFEALRERMFR